jgi:hypothetical protein
VHVVDAGVAHAPAGDVGGLQLQRGHDNDSGRVIHQGIHPFIRALHDGMPLALTKG